jgi:hypothetical protein
MRTYEYSYEAHENGLTKTHREIIERKGREGWLFVCFVPHWGAHDGKTMLFAREVVPLEFEEDPSIKSLMKSSLLNLVREHTERGDHSSCGVSYYYTRLLAKRAGISITDDEWLRATEGQI